jgi:AcrR family transcriptional regulator
VFKIVQGEQAQPKVDRRIQRTQRALIDALVALALEKGYDAVTIRDLAERADISYSTFFRHYAGKDELLVTEIKSVIDDLQALIGHTRDKSRAAEGALIFQHVAENQAFFRVLFTSQGTSRILYDVQQQIAAELVQERVFANSNVVPPEIAANHFVVTILGLIRWWLDHDMPYPVERMAAIYSHLMSATG